MHLSIWTTTFFNLEEQNSNLVKYIFILTARLIYTKNWAKSQGYYAQKFRQIHFTIWTNTFYNLDKYILQFGQYICVNTVSSINFAEWLESNHCHLFWTALILLGVIKMSIFDTIKEIHRCYRQKNMDNKFVFKIISIKNSVY